MLQITETLKIELTILVIESNNSLLQGILQELSLIGYNAVGATDITMGMEQFKQVNPILLILDVNISLQKGAAKKAHTGIALAQQIRLADPSIGIIFYSSSENQIAEIEQIYKTGEGGVGFVSAESDLNIVSIIPSVLAGHWICVITKRISVVEASQELLLYGFPEHIKQLIIHASQHINQLSTDEKETLELFGENNYAIANKLKLKINSVEARLKNIYQKMGLTDVDRRLRAILVNRAFALWKSTEHVRVNPNGFRRKS